MSKSNNVTVHSIPVFTVMTVALIIAKMTGHWDIDWVWVFAPLWIPFTLFCAIMLGVLGLALLAVLAK